MKALLKGAQYTRKRHQLIARYALKIMFIAHQEYTEQENDVLFNEIAILEAAEDLPQDVEEFNKTARAVEDACLGSKSWLKWGSRTFFACLGIQA